MAKSMSDGMQRAQVEQVIVPKGAFSLRTMEPGYFWMRDEYASNVEAQLRFNSLLQASSPSRYTN